jgi:hypothetical protein
MLELPLSVSLISKKRLIFVEFNMLDRALINQNEMLMYTYAS